VNTVVATPRLAPGSRDGIRGLLPPTALQSTDWPKGKPDEDLEYFWGIYFGLHGPLMYRLVLIVDSGKLEANKVAIRQVHESLREWFLLFADWIEVLTDQDLGTHNVPIERSTSRLASTYLLRDERGFTESSLHRRWGAEEEFYTGINPVISRQGRVGGRLDLQTFRRSLSAAATNQEVPVEQLLLRDARASLARGFYRRAVIEACTALEVALERSLGDYLDSNTSPPIAGALMDAYRGANQRLTLARRLGIAVLPNDLTTTVLTPRNIAAHGRDTTTKEIATRAVANAAAAVKVLKPI
jgi:hypothetical protein